MSERVESSSDVHAPEAPGPIAAALAIRAGEVGRVRSLFVASLLLGFALVFFYGASNALFLSRYAIDTLSWVYVANGLLTVAVGIGYSRWSRRAGARTVVVGSGWAMTISIVALWALALASDAGWVAFALATWFRLLFIFAVLGLWEVASAIFDIRQAKRLFPAVALGMMVAYMVGGAAIAPLVSTIGTANLLAVSAAAMVAHVLWMQRVVREPQVAEQLAESDDVAPAGPVEILRSPFTRRLGEMRTVTILLIYLTEFVFYEQAAAAFDTAESLAGFLGAYIAGMTLAMVIVGATVAGWWIRRFGVQIGLATLPAAALIFALVGGVWALVRGTGGFFFVLAALLYGVTQICANTIEPPAGALLFQPLPSSRRMPVRVAVDGWLGSVAIIIVGLVLLILRALPFDTVTPVVLLVVVVGAWGMWLATILFSLYRDLLRTVTRSAFTRSRDADSPFASAPHGAGLLPALSGLNDQHDDLSTAAIDPVVSALGDPAADMVALGVAATEQLSTAHPAVDTALAAVVDRDDLPLGVRSDALVSMARQAPARAKQHADRSPSTLAGASLAVRLMSNHDAGLTSQLATMLTPGTADLEMGLAAMGYADRLGAGASADPAVDAAFLSLLTSDNADDIASALAHPPAQPSVHVCMRALELGREPRHARAAGQLLQHAPASMLDSIVAEADRAGDRWATTLRASVIPAITRQPSVLYPAVDPGRPAAERQAGFEALVRADVMPPASAARMLSDDAEFVRSVVAVWRDLGDHSPNDTTAVDDPYIAALRWALEDEFAQSRRTMLAALQFDHDRAAIHDVAAILERATVRASQPGKVGSPGVAVDHQRANAVEALDVMLHSDLRRLVIPFLEPRSIEEAALDGLSHSDTETSHDRLAAMVDDSRYAQLTQRLARAALAEHREESMTVLIDRALALRSIDIFADLPIDLAIELAERCDDRAFAPGEHLMQAGSVGRELFAITQGRAEVIAEGHATIELGAGTVVGELAVLDPAPRSASVVAVEPCTVLSIDHETLLELAEQRPPVMAAIARVLARRLRST